MAHLHSPGLGTIEDAPEFGVPLVAGVSVAELPPGVARRFQALNPDSLVTAERAAELLLTVATGPTQLALDHADKLAALAAQGKAYVAEAKKLFPLVTGDEAELIEGMVKALTGAVPMLPGGIFVDADALRRLLPEASGIDVAAIVAALDALDAVRARITAADADLAEATAELAELREKAASPDAIADARRRRTNAKAARLLPALVEDLRRVRAEAAQIVSAVDKALGTIEGASA